MPARGHAVQVSTFHTYAAARVHLIREGSAANKTARRSSPRARDCFGELSFAGRQLGHWPRKKWLYRRYEPSDSGRHVLKKKCKDTFIALHV
ncbi:unnamed protein product, partial [Brenthis ino]